MDYNEKSDIGRLSFGRPGHDGKNSMSVQREEPQSVPVQREQTQSVPVQREETQSVPVQREEMQSVPVQREEMQSVPVQREEMQSVPVQREEMQSLPIQREEMQSLPVQREEMQSAPVQREEPQSVPVQREEPQSVPVQREQVQSVPVFDSDRSQVVSIRALDTGFFGYNSVNKPEGFHIREAINAQAGAIAGAVTPGYTHSLDGTSAKSVATGTAADSLFSGYNKDTCRLHHLSFGCSKNNVSVDSLIVPSQITVAFDNLSTALDFTSSQDDESLKVFIPNSTIIAPMRIMEDCTGSADAFLYLGPVFMPFITMGTTNVTGSISGSRVITDVTLDSVTPDSGFNNAFGQIDIGPVVTTSGASENDSYILPIPAGYGEAASRVDACLDRYITHNSMAMPMDCIVYEKGWEREIELDTGGTHNTLDGVAITFDITPISGLVWSPEIHEDGSKYRYNGSGMYRLTINSIDSGFNMVSDKAVYFGNADYSVGAAMGNGTHTAAEIATERGSYDQTDLFWSSSSKAYTRFPLDIDGVDAEVSIVTADYDDTHEGVKYFIAMDLPDTPGGTKYYHTPENLPFIYKDLPSADLASTSPPALDDPPEVSRVKILKNTTSEIALLIDYNDTTSIVLARKARMFSGGAFLADNGEKDQWILSQYVMNDGRAMDFNPRTGYQDPAVSWWSDCNVGDEGPGEISINQVLQNTKHVTATLFVGNSLFLDKAQLSTFSNTLHYGPTRAYNVPFASDQAAVGLVDSISYGSSCICIPHMLPTVSVAPAGFSPVGHATATSGTAPVVNADDLRYEYMCYGCNISQKQWHAPAGYKQYYSGIAAPKYCGGRGTMILAQTPSLDIGRVYSTLPPKLSDIVGYDMLTSEPLIGEDYFSSGNNRYVFTGDSLYHAAEFPLNAKPSSRAISAKGSFKAIGNMIFTFDGESVSVFVDRGDEGLEYVSTLVVSVISNFVKVQDGVVFAASDGIYIYSKGSIERLYKFSAVMTDGIVGILDGVGLMVMVYSATAVSVSSYIIDQRLGVYSSTTGSTLTGYVRTLIDDRHTPDIMLTKGSNGPLWDCRGLTTAAATSSISIESNEATVSQNGKPFYITGAEIHFSRTSASGVPLKVALYRQDSATAFYTKTDADAGAVGHNVLSLDTGTYECYSLRYKLYDIASDVEIRDVRLIGFYSQDLT